MLYLVGLFSLAHYSSERISKYYQMESNKDILYSVQLKIQFLDMQGIILTSNKILFIHNYIVSVEKQGESRLYIIYIYTFCILVEYFVFATINLLNIKLFCLTIRECTNHDTWHIHIKNSSSNHLAREILTWLRQIPHWCWVAWCCAVKLECCGDLCLPWFPQRRAAWIRCPLVAVDWPPCMWWWSELVIDYCPVVVKSLNLIKIGEPG